MRSNLFRKKNLERASSPENLDSFLRVTNPSTWVSLAALLVLLVGGICWAVFGTIESTASAVIASDDQATVCYVSEKSVTKVKTGMTVRTGDEQLTITAVSPDAVVADTALSDYAMQLGGLQSGEYVYALSLDRRLAPGSYACTIILETISPVDLLS